MIPSIVTIVTAGAQDGALIGWYHLKSSYMLFPFFPCGLTVNRLKAFPIYPKSKPVGLRNQCTVNIKVDVIYFPNRFLCSFLGSI